MELDDERVGGVIVVAVDVEAETREAHLDIRIDVEPSHADESRVARGGADAHVETSARAVRHRRNVRVDVSVAVDGKAHHRRAGRTELVEAVRVRAVRCGISVVVGGVFAVRLLWAGARANAIRAAAAARSRDPVLATDRAGAAATPG